MIDNHTLIGIVGFMINDLKLKGNELLCYAILFSLTQHECANAFRDIKYIAEWLSIDESDVYSILNSLVEKGFINKYEMIENGVKKCSYKVNR